MQPFIPTSVRVLVSPKTTFPKVAERRQGFTILLIWLAIELLLLFPVDVARVIRLLAASPVHGAMALVQVYARYAAGPVLAVLALGIVLHYFLRGRTAKPWDSTATTSVVVYAWTPHVLMVALGAGLAPILGHPAWLRHFGAWQGSGGSATVLHSMLLVLSFLPSLGLLAVGLSTLKAPPHTPASPKLSLGSQGALGGMLLLVLAFGALAAGLKAGAQWESLRPVVRGDKAPPLHLVALDGSHLHGTDTHRKVVLVDFWATWCPPCVASMPDLKALYKDFNNEDFRLVSINTEPDNILGVRRFADEHGLDFPIYVDDGSAQMQFQVQSFPTAFLIDRQGVVQSVFIGTTNFQRIRAEIQRLLQSAEGS